MKRFSLIVFINGEVFNELGAFEKQKYLLP
jgi:hypothetical protein